MLSITCSQPMRRHCFWVASVRTGARFYEEYVNHLENRIADNHVWQMTLRILTMAAFATVGELPEADTWADYCYNVWVSRFARIEHRRRMAQWRFVLPRQHTYTDRSTGILLAYQRFRLLCRPVVQQQCLIRSLRTTTLARSRRDKETRTKANDCPMRHA